MRHARVIVPLLLLLGCGSEEQSPGGSGGMSSAGSGGGAGQGAVGGSGGAGDGDAGSGGATPSVPDVFDRSIAPPSHDCRVDRTVKQCVSVSGVIDGSPIDLHCATTDLPVAIWRNPDRWPIGCRDATETGVEFRYQVDVPMQAPGAFHHSVTLGDNPLGVNFLLTRDQEGGDADADHFVNGTMAGTVEVDPTTRNDLVSGTFTARWATPPARCDGGLADVCRTMQLNGTFYLDNHLHPEDFP